MKLSDKKLQELKSGKSQFEDLNDRYLVNSQDKIEVENITKLLTESIYSFQEIVDRFKMIKDFDNDSSLYMLLYNKEFFKELIDNNVLNTEDLRYLLNKIDNNSELDNLSKNTFLLKYIADNELFQDLIDKFKSIKNYADDPCLTYLLENKKLFKELIESDRLNKEDLRYLLDRLDEEYELLQLCGNTSVLMKVLNEFMLNKENVDKFNEIIENDDWLKGHNIHTIFKYIEYLNENNEEILNLNELNKKICLLNNFDLTIEQKLEIHEILRNNEIARKTLMQIIENNLEDQYDFESLKNLLTKNIEKKKLKMNF